MIKITLGEKIAEIRKKKDISIRDLAAKSGVSKGYLSKLENNKILSPSLKKLDKIAEALGVKTSDFIEYTQDEESFLQALSSYKGSIKEFFVSEDGSEYVLDGKQLTEEELTAAISLIRSLRSN